MKKHIVVAVALAGMGVAQLSCRGALEGKQQVAFAPSISLAAGLDTTGVTWTTGGAAPWTGFVDGAGDWAASGPVGRGEESWLEARFEGPGTLSFNWTADSARDVALRLSIDGQAPTTLTGDSGRWWSRHESLPAGLHTVRWTYARDGSGATSGGWGRLDAVTLTRLAVPPLVDGVDAPGLSFSSGGPGPWTMDTSVRHDGADSPLLLRGFGTSGRR